MDTTPRSVSVVRAIAIAVVCAFLGGAIVYFVTERSDRTPGADSVDVGFLQDMIHHHQQAVVMSMAQVEAGSEGGAGLFAREILYFQSYEVGLMDGRLQAWGFAMGARPDEAMAWMGMPMDPDDMPGMASPDELDALHAATDPREVDALFFALMRDHHLGGIQMANYAAEHASDQWVRELADRMARLQTSEIAEMDSVRERDGITAEPDGYEPDPRVLEPMDHGHHGDDHGG